MDQFPKVGIVYLAYHPEPFLDRVISALEKNAYPKDKLVFIVVDNLHPKFGSSAEYLQTRLAPLSKKNLPEIIILSQKTNLGFAGGNNVGIAEALKLDCEYVFLHNQDGYINEKTLIEIVVAAESDKTIGALQSVVLLHNEPQKINSFGNNFHFLGFGYCDKYKKSITEERVHAPQKISEVGYASGAALLLRSDLLRKYGYLDEDLFLYHEDLEYSLRLKIAGFVIAVAHDSYFFHEYEFSRNREKMYLMERNRYAVLLMYYRWRTLVLLAPIAFLTDLGILFFAAKKGWLKEKIKVYCYWLQLSNLRLWFNKRSKIQALRRIPDRILLNKAASQIVFDDPVVNNLLINVIGNSILSFYWRVITKFFFW